MMEVALDRWLVFEQVEPARMEILHQIHLEYPPIKCHELERMRVYPFSGLMVLTAGVVWKND